MDLQATMLLYKWRQVQGITTHPVPAFKFVVPLGRQVSRTYHDDATTPRSSLQG